MPQDFLPPWSQFCDRRRKPERETRTILIASLLCGMASDPQDTYICC